MSAVEPWASRHVVYRMYAGTTLLYVGCTKRFEQRMREHSSDLRSANWAPSVTRVAVRIFGDQDTALAAERIAIVNEKPLFNRYRGYTRRLRAVAS